MTKNHKFHEFDCIDCGTNTHFIHEYYMLKDAIWRKIHPDYNGMLCIGCVESRLGRTLILNDFLDCPLNMTTIFKKSLRLQNRLKG